MKDSKFADYDLIDIKNKRQPESSILADALTVLLRNKFLFIFCMILSLTIGYIYIRTTPRMFMRTATIMVKDSKNGTGMNESQTFNDVFSLNTNSIKNEIGIFKSRKLMYKVAERLNLNISYRELNLKKTELYSRSPVKVRFMHMDNNKACSFVIKLADHNMVELREMNVNQLSLKSMNVPTGKVVDTPMGKLIIEIDSIATSIDSGMEILVSKSAMKATANAFCHRLIIEDNGTQSSLLNLSIVDENYLRAEDVLNTLINVYNEDAIEDKNKVTFNTSIFINERLVGIEKDLDVIDSEIEEYKKKNKLTNLSSESNMFLNNSNQLDGEGLSLENQSNMAEYMKSYLNRNNNISEMIPASIGIQDGGIQVQISSYNELVSKRNMLLTNSSERNPLIKNMNATMMSKKKAIVRAIDNLLTSLKLQTMNMKLKEQETYDKIADLPTQQKYVVSIERQQKIKEELYLYLLNKKEGNELQQILAESNCKIVDVADGSASPVSPNKKQVILICLIIGIAIPSLLIYLRLLLNMNVYVKEDIKNNVSIPFLGELPFDKIKEDRDIMLSSGSKHDQLTEALRIIRENLNFMMQEEKESGMVIQLISLNPFSGKTFITINLASNIALSNKRVLVIDMDLRKASLTRRLGIRTKKDGLSNYLSGSVTDVDKIINTIKTSLCSFDIIPSGMIPPNPPELLKDKRLEVLMKELRKRYDYILFDSPPYNLVVDAFVCSRFADNIIYVIRSGMFDKRILPELQELYDSNKLKNMSILLNCVDYNKISYNYRYHYGYHYPYGQDNKHKSWWSCIGGKFFGL